MLPFESSDWTLFLSKWWKVIDEHGFLALAQNFSNYNPPYLYLLAMMNFLFPDMSGLTAIKVISIFFNFIMAIFVYLLVNLKYPTEYDSQFSIPHPSPAILAAITVLFIPTVLINGAFWGQCDSIYTAFLIAFLYFLLSDRTTLAFVAYGFAFSFKLQAIFLAPFILWIIAAKKIRYTYLFICPIVYFLSIIPAWMLGRPIDDLLLIYYNQSQNPEYFVPNIANIYSWIPGYMDMFLPIGIGIIFTAFLVIVIAFLLHKKNINLDDEMLIFLATLCAILIPYILPKMHERYWFSAEIISIVLVFYIPKYSWIPVSLQFISAVPYIHFLFGSLIIPLHWLATAPLLILFFLMRHLGLSLKRQ